MGRQTKFDPQEKLTIAMKLFWQQGYEATSLQQLVDTMEINRFSIYNCFGDKQKLYHLALDHYLKTVVQRLIYPVLEPGAQPEAVLRYIRNVRTGLSGKGSRLGCMVQNAGMERGEQDPDVQQKVDSWYRQLEDLIYSALINLPVVSASEKQLAKQRTSYLVTVMQGLTVLCRSATDQQRVDEAFHYLLTEVESWITN